MRRCIASLCILLTLIGVSVWSLSALGQECERYAALTVQTEQAVLDGDTARALMLYDSLEEHWEDFHNLTGLFVDGGKLDAIRTRMLGLRSLIEQQHPEVMAELEGIRVLTLGLYEEELPTLWHIL